MSSNNDKIAVIGMACRYPGAKNLTAYWDNLINGKDTIKRFTDEELSKYEVNYNELKNNPGYVKARGVLEDIDKFDADFFGLTPEEAAETDPQHRVWLETAWEAFEHAGCDPVNYKGAIGVFAGSYISTYLLNNILRDPVKFENYIRLRYKESFRIMVGNDAAYMTTKTAYHLNLRGPVVNVQTACATSLVAISQACQSLFSFESDICLAGGVCILIPQESGYIYEVGSIPSPDGCCRPFDVMGNGSVFSNGAGAVVLKRLEDALNDGDMIYAVISGWANNNDGNNKVSYMAPGVDGQAEAIMMAQSFAGITPEQIGYVEAHGSATQLGDPIEIAGLNKAFSKKTDKKQYCGIGSVKGNIGNTDAAAGVASFIKACLAVYNRTIPPTINFSAPNRYIKFENTPFFVQHDLKEWTEEKKLIMGVSSFGVGGTNAHVIVEEPPRNNKLPNKNTTSDLPELIVLSAMCNESLQKRKKDLIEYISLNPKLNIKDISFTLASGRSHMPYRSFTVATGTSEINDINKFIDDKKDNLISKIAFMFPADGAEYISMGKDLYKYNKLFRQILDECFGIIKSETGEDMHSMLFEAKNIEDEKIRLSNTGLVQPALFIIEYGLTKILEQINIIPAFLIGHGIGEYSAACISGVFDMQSALRIVIKKGQLMQKMPEGMMMTVHASIEELQRLNSSYFEIAANNSPVCCSISFKTNNYSIIKELLEKNGIAYTNLNTSHALHSASFDTVISEFKNYVDKFKMKIPEIPFISCVTGKLITPEQAVSGSYWAQQSRNTVQFQDGVTFISQNNDVLFLEVGPNDYLSSFVQENPGIRNKKACIPTLGKPDDVKETHKLIAALGKMYNIGLEPEYPKLRMNENSVKINLPTYPFKRERHWIEF